MGFGHVIRDYVRTGIAVRRQHCAASPGKRQQDRLGTIVINNKPAALLLFVLVAEASAPLSIQSEKVQKPGVVTSAVGDELAIVTLDCRVSAENKSMLFTPRLLAPRLLSPCLRGMVSK